MKVISFAALIAVLSLPATAAELPQRKPGLWDITTEVANTKMPAQSARMCIDAKTDAALMNNNLSGGAHNCSKQDVRRAGAVTLVDSVCKIGESVVTSHSVITAKGDTEYHIESTGKMDPPMMGHSGGQTTQDAKWVGPCPAGMEAGDMELPGGMRVNLLKMGAMQGPGAVERPNP